MKSRLVIALVVSLFIVACATVDVTKTTPGFFEPTDPNTVEILMTRPEKPYIELGSVVTSGFQPAETAKMHNSIRAKSAPLGADAVILLNQGIAQGGLWATGVAIKYKK